MKTPFITEYVWWILFIFNVIYSSIWFCFSAVFFTVSYSVDRGKEKMDNFLELFLYYGWMLPFLMIASWAISIYFYGFFSFVVIIIYSLILALIIGLIFFIIFITWRYFLRKKALKYVLQGMMISNYNGYNKEALIFFNKSVKTWPMYSGAYFNRGKTHLKLHCYSEAILDFTKAIEFEPKNAEIYYYRGLSYLASNNLSDSLYNFTVAKNITWKYADAILMCGYVNHLNGDIKAAREDLQKAFELGHIIAKEYLDRYVLNNK